MDRVDIERRIGARSFARLLGDWRPPDGKGLVSTLAGRVLRPLATMTATVRQISADDLHRRLAATGPDDELTELAGTFDDLLGRLERAFAPNAASSRTRRTCCARR